MNDADDCTARGRHRQQEKAQPRRPTAESVPGHHHATREHEEQQNDDLNSTQPAVPAAVTTANVFAQQNQPVEQHERSGQDVQVESGTVHAAERRLAALQEERTEIGWEIVGIVSQNHGQHAQNQHDREPAQNRG
jgi:hypothetical protein